MSNILEMQHRLEQLRFADRVKELTFSQSAAPFTGTAADALIHLLEGSDILEASKKVKFYSRAAFLALLLTAGDAGLAEDTLHSSLKSSLYCASQICSDPQDFHHFLHSQKMAALLPYFQSAQHHQIQQRVLALLGQDFRISTPYEFAQAVGSEAGLADFEKAVGCLIDFCLTLEEANALSSEEIFVGCCLLICEKTACAKLCSLLASFFQVAMGKGAQLKEVIKQEIGNTWTSTA